MNCSSIDTSHGRYELLDEIERFHKMGRFTNITNDFKSKFYTVFEKLFLYSSFKTLQTLYKK